MPSVRRGAVGGMALLQVDSGLSFTVDHPPAEDAARLLDLAVRAGGAARP